MKRLANVSAILVSYLHSASAGFTASSPTQTAGVLLATESAPKPTGHANLLARSGYTKVCGYENGDLQLPLGCLPGYDCTHDGAVSVSGCCAIAATDSKCALDTTCVNYTPNAPSSAAIARAYSCDEAQPFCTTAYFIDHYAMFTCGDGQKSGTASAFYHAESAAAKVDTGNHQALSGKSDTSTPLGPIVGGAVGGLVIIVAPILLWIVLRSKRKDRMAAAGASSSTIGLEMHKPLTAQSQASQLSSDYKRPPFYSEMEVPPVELPLAEAGYAHEVPLVPAAPTSLGRSELVGSEPGGPK